MATEFTVLNFFKKMVNDSFYNDPIGGSDFESANVKLNIDSKLLSTVGKYRTVQVTLTIQDDMANSSELDIVKILNNLVDNKPVDPVDYDKLKLQTLVQDNIDYDDGKYRFVNDQEKLATTGFSSKDSLLKNASMIRFDAGTVSIMKSRYEELFGE